MKKMLLAFLTLVSMSAYGQTYSTVLLNTVEFKLPGKGWKLVTQYEVGGQYLFENTHTKVAVFLSARDKTKFEFYKDSLTDFEIVKAFYKWDADYWQENTNNEVREIKSDTARSYIIWYLKTPKVANYSLYGLKSNHLVGLGTVVNALSETEAIQLLEDIYFH